MQAGGYDAVYLAVGDNIAQRAYIPAGDTKRILDALELLRSTEGSEPVHIGRRVLIYGGGNTALDAARTAMRLGASEAIVVYRSRTNACPRTISKCAKPRRRASSSVRLSTIKKEENATFTVEKMQLDDKGFPQPTGEFESIEADALVLALGQNVDQEFLSHIDGLQVVQGSAVVDAHMMTGAPGVFAGGDMVPSERSGARALDRSLQESRA